MTYEEKLKALGIDREAITKACEGPVNPVISREKDYYPEGAFINGRLKFGPRQRPQIPQEDLTYLNPERGNTTSQRNRKWWNSLTEAEQLAYTQKRRGKRKTPK